jgi:hypothetical protein
VNSAIEQGEELIPPQAPTESLDIRPARDSTPAATTDEAEKRSIVSISMPAFSVLGNVTENGAAGDGDKSSQENRSNIAEGATGGEQDVPSENPDTLSWEETK